MAQTVMTLDYCSTFLFILCFMCNLNSWKLRAWSPSLSILLNTTAATSSMLYK